MNLIRSRRSWTIALVVTALMTIAGCGTDASDDEFTATAVSSAASPTAASTDAPAPATVEVTSEPTVVATALPPSDLEIEVGALSFTNIRFDPADGVIAPGAQIRITADVESTFEGELRVFIAPIGEDPTAFNCLASDGNQAFTLGTGHYDRWMRPVQLREGCPLPEAPVALVGFQVQVFPLDGSAPTLDGRLDADFTIDPALPVVP